MRKRPLGFTDGFKEKQIFPHQLLNGFQQCRVGAEEAILHKWAYGPKSPAREVKAQLPVGGWQGMGQTGPLSDLEGC